MNTQLSTIEMETSKQATKPISEKMKRLMEIAERDSILCDFEIVREMHGLPPKPPTATTIIRMEQEEERD